MAYDDNVEKTSDTLEDMMKSSRKELIVAGDMNTHFDVWMDLLCRDCDTSLIVVQLDRINSKLKLICSGCGGTAEVKIEKESIGDERK